MRISKSGWIAGGVMMAALIALAWYARPFAANKSSATYRFVSVERGDIVAAVAATGTINPISTVIVGSQLSGQVVEILSDYNDIVKANQMMARLNTDQLRAKADAARADLAQARALAMVQEANLEKNLADQEKARAAMADMSAQMRRADALVDDARQTLARQEQLVARGSATEVTLQAARTASLTQQAARESTAAQIISAAASLSSLIADAQVTTAQLASARASIAQREAVIRQIEVDIRNSEIRSPVDGVVVQRNVELGQTVAASLQAPTLFLVAENLDNMVIYANVDETDVGRVQPGQPAPFTVNAFPGRTFEGKVQQVRLGAQTIQNVVIYTAVIAVENPGRVLLPGMTANLRILTERRSDVLRVSNAALRFRPAGEVNAERPPPAGPAALGVASGLPFGGPPGAGGPPASSAHQNAGRQFTQFAQRIKTEVGLNAAQSASIDTIFEAARDKARIIATSDAGPAQRRESFARFRNETAEQVKALLTPEQQPKFEAIRADFAPASGRGQFGRVHRLGPQGEPQAVTVRLGASDGTFTELVDAGDLKPGDEVVIGGGPRAVTAPSAPAGPRPGL